MPVERYYIEDSNLNSINLVTISGIEFHHLVNVMRTRKGDSVELINGKGELAVATLMAIDKKEVILKIEKVHYEERRNVTVVLAQAIPKQNRLDFIIEKATEIGVDEIWLFPGKLSIKKDISGNQIVRLHAQLIAAMKQCGRLYLPELKIKPALEEWDEPLGERAFFGDVEGDAPLFTDVWEHGLRSSKEDRILFFVGPESGFTDGEIGWLRGRGVHGVRLNKNILRTDTAPLVALSLIEHWLLKRYDKK